MATRKRRERPPPQHLISTRPSVALCPRCHASVLRAYVYGTRMLMDTGALNAKAEAVVLLSGGRTYEICALGRRPSFALRSPRMITDGLPKYGYIHAAHRCALVLTDSLYRDDRRLFHGYDGDEAPF